jgi:small-conductance mechanosensitive channel
MDKPFVVGDNITVGDTTGTVEVIGMKTTRIRSISGEQIVVPNADLLKGRIRNFKRMAERRVTTHLTIVYETPADKVAAIPAMVQAIVEEQAKARFERVHISNFVTNGIEVELVYAVLTNDYKEHMDVRQAVNLGILAAFEKTGIFFWRPGPPPSVLAALGHS